MKWLVGTIANALGLAVAAWMFDGLWVIGREGWPEVVTLLVVGLILALVNEFVRPIVVFLSACLYVITLGLMYFVVNALMLMLTGWISKEIGQGYGVEDFWTALFGAIVVALVAWGTSLVLHGSDDRDRRRRRTRDAPQY